MFKLYSWFTMIIKLHSWIQWYSKLWESNPIHTLNHNPDGLAVKGIRKNSFPLMSLSTKPSLFLVKPNPRRWLSARISLNLSNLKGAGGPHICTSRRKITSDETVTPPEPTDSNAVDPRCLKKIGQLRYNAIFNVCSRVLYRC